MSIVVWRELGWKIDYRRFRRYLKDKYNVERGYALEFHLPGANISKGPNFPVS